MATGELTQSASAGAKLRERIDAWCERGILGMVLAVVVFGPVALGGVRPSEFLVLQFLTVAILVVWLVRYWFGKTHRLLWTPICWAVLLFVGYVAYRYFTADIEYVARQELIQVMVYAALFFAILNNLHRQEPTRLVSVTLISLGTLLSLYALYQLLTRSDHVWFFLKPHDYFGRPSGSYICPNHFAGFLGMLMPIAFSYTLTGRFKPVPRILLGYATVMMMAGIAVTLSRGAYVAVGGALLVFFVCILRQRSYRIIGMVCLVLLVGGGAMFYLKSIRTQERLSAAVNKGNFYNLRFRIWDAAWRMWHEHRWLGVGPGHFDQRYRQFRDAHDQVQARAGYTHNDYLNTLTDYGIVGVALVTAPWVALYWGVFWGWRFIRRKSNDLGAKKSNKSAFVLGASIGLAAMLLHSWVDFNMHIPANAITAVVLMALITSHLRFASDRFWVTQRLKGQLVGTFVLGGAIVLLSFEGWQQAREQWWLSQARKQSADPAAQLAALQKAFVVEPMNFETTYAIGENLRRQSWRGEEGWQALAETAMQWFQRGSALNVYDPYNYMRYGMCLHWLGRHAEAGEWFDRAIKLDPNGYFMRAHLGWHYFQLEDYEKAKEWFQRSLYMNWLDNPIATSYMKLADEKLAEKKSAQK